ncbi:transmembrane protein (plasmid) [Legionella adelaidensis]|uniref:Transmembrane protein n=1 Tax=Legionella adelaidensis TaxID=45056 RepID=A0A0W0R381_9GAMM|nr:DUF4845 domain-containing protein [Legionella adelaidensis]KTC65486.1 transmembrane protein [Legionella adelaidensis]VEH84693.1 transmembrane protein [Legionella adelaidensis]
MIRQNQGMTLVGMLLTMAVVIIGLILVMRVVPVYLEYFSVKSSIAALKNIPESEFSVEPSSNAQLLKEKLVNQLYINSIELPPEDIAVSYKKPGVYEIGVKYQVIKHLIAHVSLLFDFDLTEEVHVGPT